MIRRVSAIPTRRIHNLCPMEMFSGATDNVGGGGCRIRHCQFCHPRQSKLNAVLCLRPERDHGHCHGRYDLDDGQASSGSVVSGCRRGRRAGGTRGADGARRRGCDVDHDLLA